MPRIAALLIALALPLAGPGIAQQTAPVAPAHAGTAADPLPADSLRLTDFLWTHRPLAVFADSPQDPNFVRQMELLRQQPAMLAEREIVVITDTDPAARSDLRLRLRPQGFGIIVVDKNGSVLLTRPLPRTVREIAAAVDKTPQRREEVRERGGTLSQ